MKKPPLIDTPRQRHNRIMVALGFSQNRSVTDTMSQVHETEQPPPGPELQPEQHLSMAVRHLLVAIHDSNGRVANDTPMGAPIFEFDTQGQSLWYELEKLAAKERQRVRCLDRNRRRRQSLLKLEHGISPGAPEHAGFDPMHLLGLSSTEQAFDAERKAGPLRRARAAWRTWWGFCPLCNSDAPYVYACPVCMAYNAGTDQHPPPPTLLRTWKRRYFQFVTGGFLLADSVLVGADTPAWVHQCDECGLPVYLEAWKVDPEHQDEGWHHGPQKHQDDDHEPSLNVKF